MNGGDSLAIPSPVMTVPVKIAVKSSEILTNGTYG